MRLATIRTVAANAERDEPIVIDGVEEGTGDGEEQGAGM